MALLAPIEVPAAEKLKILQRLDQFRKWRSLDDERYCLVCGLLMDGHDILIVGGTRGTGPLRLVCPTHGCHSIPMDWVLPAEEILANKMPTFRHERSPIEAKPQNGPRDNLGARLRRFATQFRRAA